MTFLESAVFGLATWRIASLLVNEDGPWFIFENLRTLSGIQYHLSVPEPVKIVPDRFLPQVISCLWCTSIYIGAAWIIFYMFSPTIAFYAALPFALSTVAILVDLVIVNLKS